MTETRCRHPAMYRYTWPGRDEKLICEEHAEQVRAIADARGIHGRAHKASNVGAVPMFGEKVMKRYCVAQSRDLPAEWVNNETNETLRDVSDEDVVMFVAEVREMLPVLEDLRDVAKMHGHSVKHVDDLITELREGT